MIYLKNLGGIYKVSWSVSRTDKMGKSDNAKCWQGREQLEDSPPQGYLLFSLFLVQLTLFRQDFTL